MDIQVLCFFKPDNNPLLIIRPCLRNFDHLWVYLVFFCFICNHLIFHFSQLCNIECNIAKWASLFSFLIFRIKPIPRTLNTEKMITSGYFQIADPLRIRLHTNLTIINFQIVVLFGVNYSIQN